MALLEFINTTECRFNAFWIKLYIFSIKEAEISIFYIQLLRMTIFIKRMFQIKNSIEGI